MVQWKRICLPLQQTQETQVQSLSQEGPLEEEMTTHSSILAWKIPWTKEPGRLLSMGHKDLDTTEQPDDNDNHCPSPVILVVLKILYLKDFLKLSASQLYCHFLRATGSLSTSSYVTLVPPLLTMILLVLQGAARVIVLKWK